MEDRHVLSVQRGFQNQIPKTFFLSIIVIICWRVLFFKSNFKNLANAPLIYSKMVFGSSEIDLRSLDRDLRVCPFKLALC